MKRLLVILLLLCATAHADGPQIDPQTQAIVLSQNFDPTKPNQFQAYEQLLLTGRITPNSDGWNNLDKYLQNIDPSKTDTDQVLSKIASTKEGIAKLQTGTTSALGTIAKKIGYDLKIEGTPIGSIDQNGQLKTGAASFKLQDLKLLKTDVGQTIKINKDGWVEVIPPAKNFLASLPNTRSVGISGTITQKDGKIEIADGNMITNPNFGTQKALIWETYKTGQSNYKISFNPDGSLLITGNGYAVAGTYLIPLENGPPSVRLINQHLIETQAGTLKLIPPGSWKNEKDYIPISTEKPTLITDNLKEYQKLDGSLQSVVLFEEYNLAQLKNMPLDDKPKARIDSITAVPRQGNTIQIGEKGQPLIKTIVEAQAMDGKVLVNDGDSTVKIEGNSHSYQGEFPKNAIILHKRTGDYGVGGQDTLSYISASGVQTCTASVTECWKPLTYRQKGRDLFEPILSDPVVKQSPKLQGGIVQAMREEEPVKTTSAASSTETTYGERIQATAQITSNPNMELSKTAKDTITQMIQDHKTDAEIKTFLDKFSIANKALVKTLLESHASPQTILDVLDRGWDAQTPIVTRAAQDSIADIYQGNQMALVKDTLKWADQHNDANLRKVIENSMVANTQTYAGYMNSPTPPTRDEELRITPEEILQGRILSKRYLVYAAAGDVENQASLVTYSSLGQQTQAKYIFSQYPEAAAEVIAGADPDRVMFKPKYQDSYTKKMQEYGLPKDKTQWGTPVNQQLLRIALQQLQNKR